MASTTNHRYELAADFECPEDLAELDFATPFTYTRDEDGGRVDVTVTVWAGGSRNGRIHVTLPAPSDETVGEYGNIVYECVDFMLRCLDVPEEVVQALSMEIAEAVIDYVE
jgi:hypothetical protein